MALHHAQSSERPRQKRALLVVDDAVDARDRPRYLESLLSRAGVATSLLRGRFASARHLRTYLLESPGFDWLYVAAAHGSGSRLQFSDRTMLRRDILFDLPYVPELVVLEACSSDDFGRAFVTCKTKVALVTRNDLVGPYSYTRLTYPFFEAVVAGQTAGAALDHARADLRARFPGDTAGQHFALAGDPDHAPLPAVWSRAPSPVGTKTPARSPHLPPDLLFGHDLMAATPPDPADWLSVGGWRRTDVELSDRLPPPDDASDSGGRVGARVPGAQPAGPGESTSIVPGTVSVEPAVALAPEQRATRGTLVALAAPLLRPSHRLPARRGPCVALTRLRQRVVAPEACPDGAGTREDMPPRTPITRFLDRPLQTAPDAPVAPECAGEASAAVPVPIGTVDGVPLLRSAFQSMTYELSETVFDVAATVSAVRRVLSARRERVP